MKKIFFALMAVVVLVSTSCISRSKPAAETESELQTSNATTTVEITKADFVTKVYNYPVDSERWMYKGDKPAIVDFYATWCGPCKVIAPILEELAAEYGDRIVIYKVDTDKEKELSAAFGIRSIPTLLFIPMQGEPKITQGAMSKAQFQEIIDDMLLE